MVFRLIFPKNLIKKYFCAENTLSTQMKNVLKSFKQRIITKP